MNLTLGRPESLLRGNRKDAGSANPLTHFAAEVLEPFYVGVALASRPVACLALKKIREHSFKIAQVGDRKRLNRKELVRHVRSHFTSLTDAHMSAGLRLSSRERMTARGARPVPEVALTP